jgi:hypothetical protein
MGACAPRNTGKKVPMRLSGLFGLCTSIAFVVGAASMALAQSPEPQPERRETTIENAAGEKAKSLHPYEVTTAEKMIAGIERRITNETVRFHPYLQNAYRGGGFAAGAGYMFHPGAYSTLDVRGSYSLSSYKLAEAEFNSRRLFDRRGELTLLGGWRDATEVAFHGFGMNTSSARAERQYDRRTLRLELVHQPHRGQNRQHRRARSWPQRRAPAGPLALGHLQGEDLRRPPRHHGQGRQW